MNQLKSARTAIVLALTAALLTACSQNPVANAPVGIPTEPPFKNEEPERYQTYIVQTTPAETARFFVARDGNKWRVDSAYGSPMQVGALHTDMDYILAFGAKAYSEYEAAHGYDERPTMVQDITYGMLNGRDNAIYEKIEEGGGIVKYKYVDSKGRESIVTFDEAKGLPVSKEVFSVKDGIKTPEATISLEGFTTAVDPSNFELPKEFKKVSPQEMKAILSAK